ncbi:hypothetical protein SELMODRAFT_426581 [Selaginella moellendorffii]|uniref:Helicase C-terminal domain-containing protein n=1 Tax=Selaginella moellendorffii TaxID=88036 RepID=D8SWU5_SELML|nr:hypothetical protein SELMODRAFT_426581 [Selaginella moellendorffii]
MKWEREIAIKVAPQAQLSTLVYHDQNKRKATPETLASYDVVITTYGVVAKEVPYKSNVVTKDYCGVDYSQIAPLKKRLEKSWHLPFGPLATVAWHRVVLDEAQSIWNAYTQVSLSCRDLSATYRWGLSGTPLQNNIKDLFAFFRFLRISPHKSHADFKLHYEQFEKTGISATLKCIVLRRSKTSLIDGQPVLSLPPRLVSRVEVELSSPERQISESLRREYNNRIDEYSNEGTLQKNRFKILSMLLRLRQMYDHPALLKSEDLFQGDDLGEDNDDEDQQHMRQALNLKKLQLEAQEKQHDFERGVQEIGQSAKIDGSMNMTKREAEISRFNRDPEVMVLLLSLRAAGCGLNLVAASCVLLIDMWWNPTTEDQAIDRAHRIVQTRPVHVTKFMVKESVEEQILAIQEKKKKMVEFAFGEKGCDKHSLSMDEIISMFRM